MQSKRFPTNRLGVQLIVPFLAVLLLTSCSHEPPEKVNLAIQSGDLVHVEYTGRIKDGGVFETTDGEQARGIEIGKNETLPAFENALIGMYKGDSKSFIVSAKDAFGEYSDEPGMQFTLDRMALAHSIDPVIGQRLNAAVFLPDTPADQSTMVPVTIASITNETITVDANHPLAGKSLIFDVKIVGVNEVVE